MRLNFNTLTKMLFNYIIKTNMSLLNFCSIYILIIFSLFKIFLASLNSESPSKICIDQNFKIIEYLHENKNVLFKSENEGNNLTCATFYNSEGWHIFSVETSPKFSNKLRSFSAGFLEGYIYYEYINFHYKNIFSSILKNIPLNEKTKEFVNNQFKYSLELNYIKYFKSHLFQDLIKNDIEYHETLEIVIEQYKGLYQGYKSAMIEHNKSDLISEEDFYIITMQSDLEDIIPAFDPHRVHSKIFKKEKDCSGFVKFTKNDKNLIVGHNTHNLYTLMNRIYKYYNLGITLSTGKKLNNFKFSSRPGDMNSKDDFYMLSNQMVVLETSLEIENLEIYKNLNYKTIPKWIRVNIANRLANNNQDWINIFFKFNSGTHNNQWLIVDYKEFEKYMLNLTNGKLPKSKTKPKDIIYIVEQIPILDRKYYEDVSSKLLEDSYFASYNAPYFKEVKENIGYLNPPYNYSDFTHARRKFLFENLHEDVMDVESFKKVLRFHSKDDICDTIAPRCDLIQNRPFGAVDGKITDREMIKNMNSTIIYGPPHIEGVTKPFNFQKYGNYSHLGIPEIFNFNWIYA